ncbi:MAG: hypothetical protein RLZZ618_2289 [Pseudomonadota bacterium]|jgi:hypothetical protein
MKVHEAVQLDSNALRTPLALEGFLIVSSHAICIVEDEAAHRSQVPHFGILVNPVAIEVLHTMDIPLLAGSSVSIVGNIALKGTVTRTGIAALPLYVPYIYEFSFSAEGFGTRSFKVGDTFKNVHLQAPAELSAAALAALKPLFDPALPVVQLKRLLASKRSHLVAAHVRGEDLNTVVARIEAAGLEALVEESEVSRGEP